MLSYDNHYPVDDNVYMMFTNNGDKYQIVKRCVTSLNNTKVCIKV